MKIFMLVMGLFFLPTLAEAKLIFTEIMYDPAGTDAGHEWIEIYNDGNSVEDLSSVTFFEDGVNHKLKSIVGTSTLEAGQYAVVADDAEKFRLDWPSYGDGTNPGPLFDSSFSLKNTGEPLALKRDGEELDFVSYDPAWGGQGDGQSLQLETAGSGSWSAHLATPGAGLTLSLNVSTPSTQGVATPVDDINTNTQVVPTVSTNISTAPTSGKYFPIEPQIFCKIKAQPTALAGADQIFSAEVWGLKKEPITNARLIWNFGDGTTKEGRTVAHTFIQPGEYIIFVDAASGEYSATDRLNLKVIAPNISLVSGDGYLEMRNHDSHEIDLYGLELREGRARFAFGPHTFLSGRTSLKLSLLTLGFASTTDGELPTQTLNYFNGSVIATSSVALPVPTPIKSVVKPAVKKTVKTAKTVKKVTQTASLSSAVILSDPVLVEGEGAGSLPEPWWKQYGITILILVGLAVAGLYFFKLPIPLGK